MEKEAALPVQQDPGAYSKGLIEKYATPFRLLVMTIFSVSISEVLIMFILAALPFSFTVAERAFLDGLLLTVLIFPVLYLFLFRPMVLHINERKQAEEELQKANLELERRVGKRTAELSAVNKQLKSEIEERKRVEKELRKSQDFIFRVAESVPYLLFIYDLGNQRCIYVNSRITDMLGYTPEEIYLMGTEFFRNVLSPEDLSSFTKLNDRFATVKGGDIIECGYRMKHTSGEWRWFNVQMVVFARTANNWPREILCTAMMGAQKQKDT